MLLAEKRPLDAAKAYKRSVAINSGRLAPREKLVRLLAPIDRDGTLKAHKDLLRIREFYDEFNQ